MPLLLASAMCLSLVQVPAFAAEEEPPYEEAPVCVCEAYCTEEAVNSSCPVCSENTGLCQGEVPESPEDEEVFPEHEHSFEVLEVISDPTCTEAGEQRLACSICGMETTEAIPAVGHREAVDKAVEPTETAPGLTEGTHCEVCETVLVKQEEIPAAGTVEPEIPAEVLAFLDAVDALYDLAEIDDAEAMLSAVNEAEELYDALTWEQTGLPEVRERREALDAFWDVVTLEEDVTDAGVTTEEALRAAVANGGEVKLDGDIDLTSTLEIRSTVTLDLNGKTLNGGKKDFFIIKVTGEGTEFTLKDSSGETEDIIVSNSLDSDTIICDKGKVTGGDANWRNGGGVYVDENATFIMTSGTIIGNKARSGSGVYVCGRFEMTGGTIANNNSWDTMTDCGGGVAVRGENASFSMTGGKITGNTGRCGGGVNIYGGASFEMTAPAEISRNTANVHNAGWGGGVYVEWGSFLMHSGTISGNAAQNWGGGIVVSGQAKDWVPIPDKLGTFLMEDGTISGNAAKQGGGGVDIDRSNAEFTMTGGRITNNTAKNGGGVNLEESANFIMTGGTISGNTATQNGGGVCLETDDANKFTMSSDAVISGNTAKDGGGVYVMRNALFEMTGGTITGNSAKPTEGLHGGGGVYSAGSFTMSGGEITSNTASESGGGVNIDSGAFIMKDGEISDRKSVV